ncbi:MAG: [acyl-carrier-protein] S-malonyltransferase [Kiloniella sp.]|nr:[acyl-carrier-protein] S-malonyltransferase [Kiloniella sp.]RZO32807.1 MAG: [acyl-carrier-protein] S-malonyltransferase [Rhodospirillaceae bacterium]
MRAFVFPGQGSQKIGMGQDLAETFPAARAVFDEVDEALGENLSSLIFEGSDDDLRLTENTQPALMAVSLAVVRTLEAEYGIRLADHGSFVAGHSLGEYAALAAVGALPVADTARLLRLRGRAMQSAVPIGEGAMAAVLGLSLEQVEIVLSDVDPALGACEIANDNAEGQVVISGATAAISGASEAMKAAGAKRALPLPVSAPFHCSMMQPAADAMAEALAEQTFAAPALPVVANVLAEANSDPAQISDLLVTQVTGRVRWRESVAWMAEQGVTALVELGAGAVLSGLTKRIAPSISAQSVGTADSLREFADSLG